MQDSVSIVQRTRKQRKDYNMKKSLIMMMSLIMAGIPAMKAQDVYEDDIYYNPKAAEKERAEKKRKANYIENIGAMDVDAYNLGGMLTPMPQDTIGLRQENGEDFVYTQQIQKYYNPTIVIDNADMLADVLNNSYGNVDIVVNNGIIGFAPYSYSWNRPYYSGYYSYSPWGWGSYWSPGWGWNVGLGWYDPWYSWGPSWGFGWGGFWGPGWAWNPGYWGPGWGPSWYPGWGGHHHHYADYTPRGNRRTGAGGNWANNTRPGGNYAGQAANSGHRRVNGTSIKGTSTGNLQNGHRTYRYGGQTTTGNSTVSNKSYNSGNRRVYNYNTNSQNRSTTTNRQTYNMNTNNNRRSYNSTQSTQRSYNSGGFSTGGGGHRSTGGGGGGRGRHR